MDRKARDLHTFYLGGRLESRWVAAMELNLSYHNDGEPSAKRGMKTHQTSLTIP